MANISELLAVPEVSVGLEQAETALRSAVVGDDPFLTEVAGHLIAAGGKRLRPTLSIAAALAGGRDPSEQVVLGGVACELVHLGSLYHDDVMDEAETRRGVASVNATWGNLVAIVAGDYLLARASGIAAELGVEVTALLASTIGRLCEGQVAEVRTTYDVARQESSYFTSITGKTASLLSAACRIGGLTAGLDRRAIEALTAFGESFGIVFQIQDDVLDVVGTDEQLGKPAGHDLVEGVYTLPVIVALAHPETGPELRGLLGGQLDEPARDKAREIVRGSGALAEAVRVGRSHADRASAALEALPPCPERNLLARLGHNLLDDLQV